MPVPGEGVLALPVMVGDLEVPGDLPALLDQLPEQRIPARLVRAGIETTRALLEIPRSTWFGREGQCYQPGVGGPLTRDALERYLLGRWGVGLGCLATVPEDRSAWGGGLDRAWREPVAEEPRIRWMGGDYSERVARGEAEDILRQGDDVLREVWKGDPEALRREARNLLEGRATA